MTGSIERQRIPAQLKGEILYVIAQAQERGVTVTRVCQMLQLSSSRYYAWKRRGEGEERERESGGWGKRGEIGGGRVV